MMSWSSAPFVSMVVLRHSSSASRSDDTLHDSSCRKRWKTPFFKHSCLAHKPRPRLDSQLTCSPVRVLSSESRKFWSSSFLLDSVLMILRRASCWTTNQLSVSIVMFRPIDIIQHPSSHNHHRHHLHPHYHRQQQLYQHYHHRHHHLIIITWIWMKMW